jgi:NAD(P)-dependent dehydrogenase (short-subunit alcohol dehydrogenase family)
MSLSPQRVEKPPEHPDIPTRLRGRAWVYRRVAERNTMSRIFISGSSTGTGMMAALWLTDQGHAVVLHARSAQRAEEARPELPHAKEIVVGDLETIAGAKEVAAKVNALGHFDAVVHNAAVGYRERYRLTADDLPHVFATNTLSAYILTALIERPKRFVYLSSGQAAQVHRPVLHKGAGQ